MAGAVAAVGATETSMGALGRQGSCSCVGVHTPAGAAATAGAQQAAMNGSTGRDTLIRQAGSTNAVGSAPPTQEAVCAGRQAGRQAGPQSAAQDSTTLQQ
jgi:hypothetical protein